ncbi:hypothetical protein AB0M48_12280 [Lentzea sp. NPDC051208]|uniref:hypothetical protein n=1 Tax=Lentzea sp. NPDC051208 TaxID=3154642 RepID=UPI00342E21EC
MIKSANRVRRSIVMSVVAAALLGAAAVGATSFVADDSSTTNLAFCRRMYCL